jgi:undecaprenyl-diphosphatase
MPILHALILGIIQGITEFFPVSSSAHLKVAEHLMQLQSSPSLVLVDLFCHLGTAVAIIYFFKKELFSLFTK